MRSFNWSNREKYYKFFLKNLGNWRDSLSNDLRSDQGPDFVWNQAPGIENFKEPKSKGRIAFENIEESIPEARLYLSEESVKILDKLILDDWHISEHDAVSMDDYLSSMLKRVDDSYNELLKHAKRDLGRRKYALLSKIVANNKSSQVV
jgi:hypothetical protein